MIESFRAKDLAGCVLSSNYIAPRRFSDNPPPPRFRELIENLNAANQGRLNFPVDASVVIIDLAENNDEEVNIVDLE